MGCNVIKGGIGMKYKDMSEEQKFVLKWVVGAFIFCVCIIVGGIIG